MQPNATENVTAVAEEPELNYQYSVIYDFDIPREEDVADLQPPHHRRLWQLTEGNDQRNYAYLCNCEEDDTCWCGWRFSKHRKYCALLTQAQFDEFVNVLGLCAEDVETMGSLGAPGFGYGSAPAISFLGGGDGYLSSAYVTPCPFDPEAEFWDEETWKKLRRQVIDHYK